MLAIPFYRQKKHYTCGPAVLRMALAALGIRKTEEYLAKISGTSSSGTGNYGLSRALRKLKLSYTSGYRMAYKDLLPATKKGVVIVDWMPQLIFPEHPEFINSEEFNPKHDAHYAIVIAAGPSFIMLQDPVLGRRVRLPRTQFVRAWRDAGTSYHWMLVLLDAKTYKQLPSNKSNA